MSIMNGFEKASIERAVSLLREGDVVAFPTETVYGLGADVYNPYAVAKIFEIKNRPRFDPLIVHIGERDWVYQITESMPALATRLAEAFWPGPLTIILRKKGEIPDIVTSGLDTVGVRMPSHPVALNLIRAFGKPLAAPSANPFGYVSPTKAIHVAKAFKGKLHLVLDGGDSLFGVESTIVAATEQEVFLLRHGAIPVEELSEVAGKVREKVTGDTVEAPGQLPYHYAPHTPLAIISSPAQITTANSGFLALNIPAGQVLSKHVKILSETGDLREAAANFFSHLIELDGKGVEIIYAERIPETGIGRAIMDRLRKASQKRKQISR
jgi:L-threonylcarbamoyladenylate synthase